MASLVFPRTLVGHRLQGFFMCGFRREARETAMSVLSSKTSDRVRAETLRAAEAAWAFAT